MKKTLRPLFVILFLFLLSGCSLFIYPEKKLPNYRNVTNHEEQMEILRTSFSDIYGMVNDGTVVVERMYTYKDEDGNDIVHITYRLVKFKEY